MLALKRLWLVIFVLVVPAIVTGLLYWGTQTLLAATNRVIDPTELYWISGIEFAVLFLVAALDAKGRWSESE